MLKPYNVLFFRLWFTDIRLCWVYQSELTQITEKRISHDGWLQTPIVSNRSNLLQHWLQQKCSSLLVCFHSDLSRAFLSACWQDTLQSNNGVWMILSLERKFFPYKASQKERSGSLGSWTTNFMLLVDMLDIWLSKGPTFNPWHFQMKVSRWQVIWKPVILESHRQSE